jgi:hypothetical protein
MTQKQRILKYLDDFGSISPQEAMVDLGILRLAARISELVKAGEHIETVMTDGFNRYGQRIRFARYRRTEQ